MEHDEQMVARMNLVANQGIDRVLTALHVDRWNTCNGADLAVVSKAGIPIVIRVLGIMTLGKRDSKQTGAQVEGKRDVLKMQHAHLTKYRFESRRTAVMGDGFDGISPNIIARPTPPKLALDMTVHSINVMLRSGGMYSSPQMHFCCHLAFAFDRGIHETITSVKFDGNQRYNLLCKGAVRFSVWRTHAGGTHTEGFTGFTRHKPSRAILRRPSISLCRGADGDRTNHPSGVVIRSEEKAVRVHDTKDDIEGHDLTGTFGIVMIARCSLYVVATGADIACHFKEPSVNPHRKHVVHIARAKRQSLIDAVVTNTCGTNDKPLYSRVTSKATAQSNENFSVEMMRHARNLRRAWEVNAVLNFRRAEGLGTYRRVSGEFVLT
ncbi:hypothetical protein EDC04DRAFT_2608972 [Pisolithus marmoratus]|nr:hypothetical protein EDC04DRAFT_2608972 [Pisolithus marmoratus]